MGIFSIQIHEIRSAGSCFSFPHLDTFWMELPLWMGNLGDKTRQETLTREEGGAVLGNTALRGKREELG